MKRYLVAVSGGPDSMVLLDTLRVRGYNLVIAHVNYNKRDSALRDMLIVNEYARRYSIPLVIKNAFSKDVYGNFQNWARDFRYHFFKEIYDKYHCDALLIAHQEDDLIETYLMQKEKNLRPHYYGLKKDSSLYGMIISRPLLNVKRSTILRYLKIKKITYGIDESNLTNDYRRNQLRHEIVEKMDDEKRNEILSEIASLNYQLIKKEELIKKTFQGVKKISIQDFLKFEDQKGLLRYLLYNNLSDKHLNDLIRSIKDGKSFEVKIKDKYFVKEYGYIESYDCVKSYHFSYDKLCYTKEKYFAFVDKGTNKQALSLSKDDYPITVRNFENGDKIKMRYGTKKVSRFFIDNKIPSKYRKIWPVVVNKNHEIIFVPQIGANINHYCTNSDLFVVESLY